MMLRDRAKGRWPEILTHAGIAPDVLDGKHHPCPGCGGTDRFRYTREDAGAFFCGDTNGDGFDLLMHVRGCDFATAATIAEDVVGKGDMPEPQRPTYAQRLQSVAKRVPRSRYLEARGLEMPPGLRFAREVKYYGDDGVQTFPAMLAPITREGKFLTYHVTYLAGDRKAPVKTPRKMMPGPSATGASVALYPAAEHMGIGEGIETCIAAHMLHGLPVWSALNTSLLKAWEPPRMARKVSIFADNDPNFAGHAAAYQLAYRLHKKGIDVQVCMPMRGGDWNDVLNDQRRRDAA